MIDFFSAFYITSLFDIISTFIYSYWS